MTKWVTKTLIQLADYHNGMAFKPSDWAEEGTKIIRIEQLNNPLGHYDYYKGEYPEINAISNGDLIFSWSATLKVCIWQWGDGVLNQHLFKVVPFKDIDKTYLLYLLDYNMPKLSESSHGSTMKHIKRKELETYTVSIPALPDGTPDLAEQKRIASILSSADNVIATSEALIEKYKSIKQGMLTDLLTPKKGWKKVKLGEVYNFRYGEGNTNPNNEGPFPIYGANGIIGGYTKYNAENSIVIGHMGEYAGSVIWVDGKHFVTYNGTITTVKNENILHDRFGYFLLLSLNIKQICAGSGQPFLAYDKLNSIPISFPNSIIEQKRIASILSSIDAKIVAEEKVVEKYKGVKKGLMEEMLKETNVLIRNTN